MLVSIEKNYPGGSAALIALSCGRSAIVDPGRVAELAKYHWFAKKSAHCWYIVAKIHINGIVKILRLHRFIAKTPINEVCHHINGNTFDAREANLRNMTPFEHAKYYSYW